ncbi:SDR family NAD(P)-dependent oxidoreductase [uncultured Nisaea sp.]|uniref:SDR family NAD(P)-dependent oxidoreductase n=1 Tax=uncultured Nisaea sp. TaxID=538215 RepID=UPI0030EC3AC0|tara:strand:- start:1693 stop:2454 length:762 start_codon:yes stop_codon:yes gene_type:complete
MQVQGQAAIVTGGGSGLGAGTARVLAAAGAKVALFDVNEEGAQKVAAEIGGIAVPCDVSDAASAEAAIATAREAHGPARILVNCAGIAPAERIVSRNGPMPLDNFRKVIEVNLIGTFNMMRLAAADMQGMDPLEDGERGIVISTASVAAFEGQIGQSAYAASKGGVHALTIVGAREFAKVGIRFNTIAPGLFGTPMLLGMPQDVQDSLAATVPYPSRFGTPEEYAKLAMAMIDNVMLNGETVRLDGAIRMQPR